MPEQFNFKVFDEELYQKLCLKIYYTLCSQHISIDFFSPKISAEVANSCLLRKTLGETKHSNLVST